MSYILAPFNPNTPYDNQVSTELNYANNNFTVLGQAFYNNDPSSNPVLRASYVGSSAPSNPVAGMTWLDTSTTPPTLKVYDGSNWQRMASLNSSGVLDLSNSYVKSNVYIFRRINGNSLTSDYFLNLGEEAFYSWDTSASTSLNLHISTGGGIYQIIINGKYNTSADVNLGLYPNNTSYSNAITITGYSVVDGGSSVNSFSSSSSFFNFDRIGSGGIGVIYCSTYTDRKFLTIEERMTRKTNGGMVSFFGYKWNDTSTDWTSLGTLSVDSANGVIYVLVRRLV